MATYSLRINTNTGTYHIFKSENANDDVDTSLCGGMDYAETDNAEGLSNLTRDEIIEEYANDAIGVYCHACRNTREINY
jgi:hypothetical protein